MKEVSAAAGACRFCFVHSVLGYSSACARAETACNLKLPAAILPSYSSLFRCPRPRLDRLQLPQLFRRHRTTVTTWQDWPSNPNSQPRHTMANPKPDFEAGVRYWEHTSADVDGVLGGYGEQVVQVPLQLLYSLSLTLAMTPPAEARRSLASTRPRPACSSSRSSLNSRLFHHRTTPPPLPPPPLVVPHDPSAPSTAAPESAASPRRSSCPCSTWSTSSNPSLRSSNRPRRTPSARANTGGRASEKKKERRPEYGKRSGFGRPGCSISIRLVRAGRSTPPRDRSSCLLKWGGKSRRGLLLQESRGS